MVRGGGKEKGKREGKEEMKMIEGFGEDEDVEKERIEGEGW